MSKELDILAYMNEGLSRDTDPKYAVNVIIDGKAVWFSKLTKTARTRIEKVLSKDVTSEDKGIDTYYYEVLHTATEDAKKIAKVLSKVISYDTASVVVIDEDTHKEIAEYDAGPCTYGSRAKKVKKATNESLELSEGVEVATVGMDEDSIILYCNDCGDHFMSYDMIDDETCPLCGSDDIEEVGVEIPDGVVLEEGANLSEGYVITEATKKIVRNGQVVKVKIKRKRKIRLSAKQKQALRKARLKSHRGSAEKARRKSNKIRARRGLNEDVVLPTELTLTESLGLAIVSEMTTELESIARDLNFELNEDNYTRVIGDYTLVLDSAEGDVEGVVIYAVDATGVTVSEDVLQDILTEAGIEFDQVDDEDDEDDAE